MQVQTHNNNSAPNTGDPKPSRRPLQPLNFIPKKATTTMKPKLQECRSCSSNTVNTHHPAVTAVTPPIMIESLDASLGEELSAMKKRMERLKLDRERTDKLFKDRDVILDTKMKEMYHRGDIQKELEIEVDRLYRLKQLKLLCMSVSPIKTLREKQHGNKSTEATTSIEEATEEDDDEREESVGENILKSPNFGCSSSTHEETSDCVSVSN